MKMGTLHVRIAWTGWKAGISMWSCDDGFTKLRLWNHDSWMVYAGLDQILRMESGKLTELWMESIQTSTILKQTRSWPIISVRNDLSGKAASKNLQVSDFRCDDVPLFRCFSFDPPKALTFENTTFYKGYPNRSFGCRESWLWASYCLVWSSLSRYLC